MVQIQENVPPANKQGGKPGQQDEALKKSLSKIRNKLLVMSGKGGVGKSSTSVNLSIALSKMGFKVGLMDVDLHGPDIPRMLGMTGLLDINEARQIVPLKYSTNLAAVSIESLSQSKDDPIIWRGPLKFSAIRQFVADVAWGDLDYLIIDAPPGTGDEPLTVAQTIPDAKAVVVTTPQEIALADVRKSINFCHTIKMDILGVIENMSGFNCPHCGEAVDLFGNGGGEKTARAMDLTLLGKVPFDLQMVKAGDAGRPFMETAASSPVGEAFTAIAKTISERTA